MIEIINLDGMSDFGCIDATLRALIESIAGTIPGSRNFGLTGGATNLLPEDARNTFAMELDEKVEEYLPEIAIEDVSFESVGEGELLLRISVASNEEDDDD